MNVFDLWAKISLDTSEYDKGLDNAEDKANSLGSKIKSGLATAAKVGAVAIGAVTTAVTAFAAASVTAGSAFDSSMSQVAATMGVTVKDIQNLRDFALEMGSSTAFSASQAADALNFMALAGYTAEESMEALPNVLNLAAAGGIELARASDMITDAQSALGLSMEQSAVMVDQMAKAASKSNTSVAQLGDAILTVGGTASFMSGGTQQLSTVLGILADNGVKGAEAGTHLRNMILSLSSPTENARSMLDYLGVSIFDSEGVMRDFADVFPDLNKALDGMADEDRLHALSTIFNSRDIASATALLNTSVDRWEELGGAIGDADGAAKQMAKTQLDNLAGNITLFKSALEGAQIAISDGLTPSLRGFVQFGTEAISTLSVAFQEGGLSGAMEALGTILSDGLNMVIESLPSMIDAGMQLLGALGQGLLDNLPVITESAIEILVTLTEGVLSALPSLVKATGEIITTLITTLAERFPDIIDTGFNVLEQMVDGIVSGLPDMISRLPEIIDGFLNFITENLPNILERGVALLNELVNGIIGAIPGLLAALPQIIVSFTKFIAENSPKIVKAGIDLLMNLVTGIIKSIPELVKALPSIIVAIVTGIGNLMGGIVDIGKNIVTGIWNGISNMASWIGDKVSGFFGGIVDGVKDFLGIHSPSTVFANMGKNMALGLGEGWDDEFSDIQRRIENGMDFGTANIDFASSGMGALAANVANSVSAAEGGETVIPITLELDGEVLARVTYRYNKSESARIGQAMVQGV